MPEFFYDPDVLLNRFSLELGEYQGSPIGDVEIPQWASSAADFVCQMSSALECPLVSDQLHSWINLVFGQHQQSPRHFNTFPSCLDTPGRCQPAQDLLGEPSDR